MVLQQTIRYLADAQSEDAQQQVIHCKRMHGEWTPFCYWPFVSTWLLRPKIIPISKNTTGATTV